MGRYCTKVKDEKDQKLPFRSLKGFIKIALANALAVLSVKYFKD